RFQLLVQKAAEICQEVKSLGNNLLSVMEKEDGEALMILRARHESIVMEMVEDVKYGQLQEAIKSNEGLFKSLALAVQRYSYYELQLGKKADEIEEAIPELGELDKDSLDKMKFAMEEPGVAPHEIEVDIAQDLGASGGKIISSHEKREFESLERATKFRQEAINLDMIAKFLSLIPELGVQAQPGGVGGAIQFGGRALSTQLSLAADGNRITAERDTHEAGKSAKIGSYSRREQDWAFQSNLAAGEVTQIFKQLRAAQIREAIAELELKNHRQQIKHAEEIEHFLNEEGTEKTGKKTNKALYVWMKREVKGLYAQCFQFSFDIAKKAERALQHELGNPELSYLEFGYLAGKEGLLAGEKLYLDIKRMEMAYYDHHQREYELTKHVSLLQVDPLALLKLRTTGRCTVRLPEELFDMDGPGHYFRRIKTVALSIPCVTGPYASVNCTLTMLKSSIRKTQVLRGGYYAREDAEDDRFNDYFGSLQSIVTSSAQNDSGLFETNLHDERYLPFENSGVVSEWQLELPAEVRQFDYDTISDVILHLSYTAREGGGLLKNGAIANLQTKIGAAQAAGSVRLFSVRHEFPTEWAKFTTVDLAADPNILAGLTLDLRDEHYPFWSKDEDNNPIGIKRVDIFAKPTKETGTTMDVFDNSNAEGDPAGLEKDTSLNNVLVGKLTNTQLPAATGEFTLYFTDNSMEDLWLALTWGK
ncbi:MAG: insecticidal toxin protein, partial [Deltaproteobacteria bacterium]|nr:insecticidal toxin protein [Deltaproteobacteria bacterium]